MATKIISVISGKGGILKTTTSCNVAAALAMKGKKVCILDIDKQSHTTKHLFRYNPSMGSISDIMLDGGIDPYTLIQGTDVDNLYIIPAAFEKLAETPRKIEYDLSGNRIDRLGFLKTLEDFDFIIIDCPPELELLTRNALYVSDYVLVPVTGDRWGTEGFALITQLIEEMRNRHNPKLKLLGVFLVKDDNSSDNKKAKRNYSENFGRHFFKTTIRNSKLASRATYSLPLVVSYPNSKVSEDYKIFTDEILEKING